MAAISAEVADQWSYRQLAKMFRYLGMSKLCDATFVVFLLSWLITRHFLFLLVIKATWETKYVIPRVWDPSRGHFMTKEIYIGFFAMLVALQVCNLHLLSSSSTI